MIRKECDLVDAVFPPKLLPSDMKPDSPSMDVIKESIHHFKVLDTRHASLLSTLHSTLVSMHDLSLSLEHAADVRRSLLLQLNNKASECSHLKAQLASVSALLESERVLSSQLLQRNLPLETELAQLKSVQAADRSILDEQLKTIHKLTNEKDVETSLVTKLQTTLKDRDALVYSLRATASDLSHEVRQCTEKIQSMSVLKSEHAQLMYDNTLLAQKLSRYESMHHRVSQSCVQAVDHTSSLKANHAAVSAEADLLVFEGLSEVERPAFLNEEENTADSVLRHLHDHVESLEHQLLTPHSIPTDSL
ncbi:hypothetical protein BDV3_001634 [Batrachochytrium dendrobatidis]|nr:hypothetical protein QVD99_006924 [Batrachochytrium dendrobatidis]